MTYDSNEARRELLDAVATVAGRLSAAIALLSDAYDALDDQTADRLESELFGPVQAAYAAAKRTGAGFASRHDLTAPEVEGGATGGSHKPARELITAAVDQCAHADALLVELQDSMRPVEVGDAELRAGLADVRSALASVRANATALLSRLGR